MTALHVHSHTCLVSLLFIPSLYITFFNSKNFLIVFVKILKSKTVALHKCQILPIILNCKAKTVLCLIIDYFTALSAVSIFFQCKKNFPCVLVRILIHTECAVNC